MSTQSDADGDRFVIVGRRFSNVKTTWSEWDKPFDDVLAAIVERAQDRKASGHPDEVLEVVVVRRAKVQATVSVEEVAS